MKLKTEKYPFGKRLLREKSLAGLFHSRPPGWIILPLANLNLGGVFFFEHKRVSEFVTELERG